MSIMDHEKSLQIARKIRDTNVQNKENYFKDIYSNFKTKYPLLFEMCCQSNFEYENLVYMLDMMKKVNSGTHTSESASKEVGQHMFDKYVAPKIDLSKEPTIN